MSEFTNKNIWVFIETDEGKAKSVGLELLNPGRMLAEKSGEKLVAVVFGKDNAEAIEQIKGYGPDQIISVSGIPRVSGGEPLIQSIIRRPWKYSPRERG